eukprot:GHVU01112941.1.p1 GENE.GHVU01112941.1~~GHVU01112941.1.p1  ORF type:complete len:359 (-),score=70.99 GHVU01112941.1:199-1275(-)
MAAWRSILILLLLTGILCLVRSASSEPSPQGEGHLGEYLFDDDDPDSALAGGEGSRVSDPDDDPPPAHAEDAALPVEGDVNLFPRFQKGKQQRNDAEPKSASRAGHGAKSSQQAGGGAGRLAEGEGEEKEARRSSSSLLLDAYLPKELSFMREYLLEAGVGLLMIFALLHALWGKEGNRRVALQWGLAAERVIAPSFHLNKIRGETVSSCGWGSFEMYFSGRANIRYCLAKIECMPRQCPWHYWLYASAVPVKDIIDFEVVLETMDTFVFAVCRKNETKSMKSNNEDVDQCCTLRRVPTLTPFGLVLLSDAQEPFDSIIGSGEVLRSLNELHTYIHFIVLSDAAPAPARSPSSITPPH